MHLTELQCLSDNHCGQPCAYMVASENPPTRLSGYEVYRPRTAVSSQGLRCRSRDDFPVLRVLLPLGDCQLTAALGGNQLHVWVMPALV